MRKNKATVRSQKGKNPTDELYSAENALIITYFAHARKERNEFNFRMKVSHTSVSRPVWKQ